MNPSKSLRCHHLSIEERHFFSSANKGILNVSNTYQHKKVCKLQYSGGIATAIQSMRGHIFLGSYDDRILIISDTFPFEKKFELKYCTGIFDIALSPDYKYFLAGGFNGHVQLFTVQSEINKDIN